jgi:translation initiation factor IF-1
MDTDQTVTAASGREPVPTVIATVVEQLPRAVYRLRLENQALVLAHLVGTVTRNFVRLLPGDRVEVALSPQDATRGRIVAKCPADRSLNSGPRRAKDI